MSAQQTKLVVIAKQGPVPLAKGDRTHNPNQIAMAAVNKGKMYPYSSERQNRREDRRAFRKALWAAPITIEDGKVCVHVPKEAAE